MLVVGYGRRVIPHVGTDQFDIYLDQRLRRCAGLFDAAARVTDPLAFLDPPPSQELLSGGACARTARATECGLVSVARLGRGRPPGVSR